MIRTQQPAMPITRGDRLVGWLAVVLALASCLPVIVARYPQMSDYPAHLARYAVMLDGGRSADLARFYSFQWAWTGNLGVDILIRPFAALFGVEGGGRVITGLIPPMTGLGIIAVDRVLRGRVTVASLLAMPFVWSPMMLIGLLNFTLGQGLALWAFALWVWLEGRIGALWRGVLFVPIGLVVWLCHLSAWGVLGVMIFGYALSTGRWWRAFVAPWPLLAPLGVMVAFPGTTSSFSYGGNWLVYKQAIWERGMRDTLYPLDHWGLIAVGVVLVAALAFRRWDGRLGWAAVILLLMTYAVPRHISGGDYADYRLIISGLLVGCLAVNWPRAPRWVLVAPALFYLVRLAVTTQDWHDDSERMAGYLQALDHLPQGARVASAVLVTRGRWPLNHFEHIGAYAVLRRHALVNANFAVPHVHMLQLRENTRGFVDPSQRLLLSANQKIDMAHYGPAQQADWLWYVGDRAPDTMPEGAVVVWRGKDVFLAKLNPPAPPENAAPLAKRRKGD